MEHLSLNHSTAMEESVFLLSKKDKNFNQIVENFILNKQEPFILQKFISQVKDGDKRIILSTENP